MQASKLCSKCKNQSLAECFRQHRTVCNDCNNKKNRERYAANRESLLSKRQAYDKLNKNKVRQTKQDWHHRNRSRILENMKSKREENIEERRAYDRKRYHDNAENEKLRHKLYVENNRKTINAYDRSYRRNKTLQKYGINVTYEEVFSSQNGKCALSGETADGSKALAIDHCHRSNVFRGLLSNKYNLGLGHFNDDTQLLSKAIVYLAKHSISPITTLLQSVNFIVNAAKEMAKCNQNFAL